MAFPCRGCGDRGGVWLEEEERTSLTTWRGPAECCAPTDPVKSNSDKRKCILVRRFKNWPRSIRWQEALSLQNKLLRCDSWPRLWRGRRLLCFTRRQGDNQGVKVTNRLSTFFLTCRNFQTPLADQPLDRPPPKILSSPIRRGIPTYKLRSLGLIDSLGRWFFKVFYLNISSNLKEVSKNRNSARNTLLPFLRFTYC